MSRSGTESIARALEQLGYDRTYHGIRTMSPSNDGFMWEELTNAKFGANPRPITPHDLDKILGNCMAVTDMPCAAFWSELMDAYPEAKILLVERDVESWYRSFEAIVIKGVFSWKAQILAAAMKMGLSPRNPNSFIRSLFLDYFRAKNVRELAANARDVYREHYDAITARALAEGRPILRMRIEEGWGPVCQFLGKDVPEDAKNGKLPKGNEAQALSSTIADKQRTGLRMLGFVLLQKAVVVGGLAGVALLVHRRYLRR